MYIHDNHVVRCFDREAASGKSAGPLQSRMPPIQTPRAPTLPTLCVGGWFTCCFNPPPHETMAADHIC